MAPERFGRYRVIRQLGQGGMATVFLARDPGLQRDVAVKVLPRQFVQDAQFRQRFEREAAAIGRLNHEGIVQVYDFGEEDGQPYLVLEYMPGGSLADRLRGAKRLSVEETVAILGPVAEALDFAHAGGVIHRDIKPENILFDAAKRPHLADFGISRLSDATHSLTHLTSLGTPAYMSPEQCRGEPPTPASDIYSLGVVAYQMLTGVLPFVADSPFAVMRMHIEDVPRPPSERRSELAVVDGPVLRVLAKAATARPGSAKDLVSSFGTTGIGVPRHKLPDTQIREAIAATRAVERVAEAAALSDTAVELGVQRDGALSRAAPVRSVGALPESSDAPRRPGDIRRFTRALVGVGVILALAGGTVAWAISSSSGESGGAKKLAALHSAESPIPSATSAREAASGGPSLASPTSAPGSPSRPAETTADTTTTPTSPGATPTARTPVQAATAMAPTPTPTPVPPTPSPTAAPPTPTTAPPTPTATPELSAPRVTSPANYYASTTSTVQFVLADIPPAAALVGIDIQFCDAPPMTLTDCGMWAYHFTEDPTGGNWGTNTTRATWIIEYNSGWGTKLIRVRFASFYSSPSQGPGGPHGPPSSWHYVSFP